LFAKGPSLLIAITCAPRFEISFHESLKVHSSVSQTGELAATINDKTNFLSKNSLNVLIFKSGSASSKSGAESPTFKAID